MSAVLALGVLTASLLGSMHCAGMCGGFVCFYATGADGRAGGTGSHVAYNVGRLVSYLVLGLLAGVLGQGLDRVGGLVGLSRGAAVANAPAPARNLRTTPPQIRLAILRQELPRHSSEARRAAAVQRLETARTQARQLAP